MLRPLRKLAIELQGPLRSLLKLLLEPLGKFGRLVEFLVKLQRPSGSLFELLPELKRVRVQVPDFAVEAQLFLPGLVPDCAQPAAGDFEFVL